MRRSVVITAMGVVSALGNDPAAILTAMDRGRTAFRPTAGEDGITIAPVDGFDIKDHTGRLKNARYLNRGAALAVAAAQDAIRQAGLHRSQWEAAGLFMGAGPNLDLGGDFPRITSGAMDRPGLSAMWMLRYLPNTAASVISQRAGIHGENTTVTTACAAALQAIGEAFRRVRDGYLDRALAGGGDSRLSHGGLLAYKKAQALRLGTTDARDPYVPFHQRRRGFVPGEGAAFFLLETRAAARARGATILGEICGYASSLDAHAMAAPDPSGRWAEAAVRAALADGRLEPAAVDLISAHGTGTDLNDRMEADLIARVFAGGRPRITAFKSWVGHLASACGAMETALGLICMGARRIAPIRHLDAPCHPDLNFVTESQTAPIDTLLLENFGFGGQNAALVVRSEGNHG